jgi:hypothetical protein
VLHLPLSKTDQEGRGEKIRVPFARSRWCPLKALDWLARAEIQEGPIFRPIDRHGHVQGARLSSEAVSLAWQRLVSIRRDIVDIP